MVGELRARQIVHLHRLFRVIANEFSEEGMDPDRLDAYHDHEVSPNDFKATKTDHEDALMVLAEEVSDWAGEQLDDVEEVRRPPRVEP